MNARKLAAVAFLLPSCLLGRLTPKTLDPATLAAVPASLRPGEAVCSRGYVESVRRERDGDLHVWMCPEPGRYRQDQRRGECILGEIVPSQPLPRPAKGSQIEMCGSWRPIDLEHGWPELHPLTNWRMAP